MAFSMISVWVLACALSGVLLVHVADAADPVPYRCGEADGMLRCTDGQFAMPCADKSVPRCCIGENIATATCVAASGGPPKPTPANKTANKTAKPTPVPPKPKIGGTVTIAIAGATKSQVETATKSALATQFGVATSAVTVTAKKSRRLADVRQLAADSWALTFEVTVEPAAKAAATTKAAGLKSNAAAFTTDMKTGLVAAGVQQSDVDAVAVSAFTAEVKVTATTKMPGALIGQVPGMHVFLSGLITSFLLRDAVA